MKNNTLFLRKMGMDDNTITTDIKNHRVRTIENIDILYNGKHYYMFFEFLQCTQYQMRYKNKRTGKELKHPVREVVLTDALCVDTQYEEMRAGSAFPASWCCSQMEREIWNEHHKYTRRDILEIINRYKIGAKFTDIKLID